MSVVPLVRLAAHDSGYVAAGASRQLRLTERSPSDNRLGSCNAACGRYRRRHQNGSLGKGAGHPSAELSLGSRGVMNRRTLAETQCTNGLRNWLRSGDTCCRHEDPKRRHPDAWRASCARERIARRSQIRSKTAGSAHAALNSGPWAAFRPAAASAWQRLHGPAYGLVTSWCGRVRWCGGGSQCGPATGAEALHGCWPAERSIYRICRGDLSAYR